MNKSLGIILSDLGDICGSDIGNHGKFCTKGRKDCTIANHSPKRRENGLYVVVGSSRSGLVTEHVPMRVVQTYINSIRELQRLDLTKGHWLAVMAALNDIEGIPGDEDGLEDNFHAIVESIKGRISQQRDTSGEPSPFGKRPGKKLLFSPMARKSLGKVDAGLAEIRAAHKIEDEAVSAHIEALKKETGKVLSDIKLDLRLNQASVGMPGLEDPPLAASIKAVSDRIDQSHVDIKALVGTTETTRKDVSRLSSRVSQCEQRMVVHDGFGTRVRNNERSIHQAGVLCRALTDRVQEIDSKCTGRGVAKMAQGGNDRRVDQRLRALESQSTTPLSAKDRISIDNGRWEFMGEAAVDKFLHDAGVTTNGDVVFEIVSLVTDPVELWHQANSDGVVTREEFQAEEIHTAKTKRSPRGTALAAAGQSVYPASLMGARASNGVGAVGAMNKINTYDLFNKGDGVTGVYNVTIKALENLRPIELTRIEDDLRHHPQLREISTFLFTYCVNFLIDLLRWVDSNYSSMVYKMSANKDEGNCWKLQLLMFRTVWEVLWDERRIAKNAHTQEARRGLVSYFHACLNTHVAMVSFKRKMFSEHPRLFPKLMTFVFESHTPRAEHLAVKKALSVANDKITALQRERDNIVRRLTALEGGNNNGGGGKWQNKKKKMESEDE